LELLDIWKNFAGPIPANLSFSKNSDDPDTKLLHDLSLARLKYSIFPQFKYYFSPPPTAPKQKIQWVNSRRCVLKVLDSFPLSKQTWISLSHTAAESLVIGCHDEKGIVTGIGVDMEEKDRLIEPAATDKFILPSELSFGLSAIAIWTIKEASYKADSARLATVVSQYEIKDFAPTSGEGRVGLQEKSTSFIRFKFVNFKNLAVTFAIAEG
jgi:hypothetical protein